MVDDPRTAGYEFSTNLCGLCDELKCLKVFTEIAIRNGTTFGSLR
jgi:hypothetical protein